MRKDWVLITIIGLIVVVGLGLMGYLRMSKKTISANPEPSASNQAVAGASMSADYFAEDAKVMYFYSDFCHWCVKEKEEVFPEIAKLGLKVKPMNVGEKPALGQQFNITGTPTFVAANGDRLVGFQDLPALKKFLEDHK